ncbi:sigma-70 family RNA polymerase sigma factor [Paenibacillaceae bacterium]|nr:sigma-70 family RNA polymerase sigma factor [Paenibacillaceae bacterium]
MKQASAYEKYRTEIYRIGWRLQYKVKKIRRWEAPLDDAHLVRSNLSAAVENKIWIQDLINSLSPQGKKIINKIYIQGMTEAEVAEQLHISQQAVNKWKQKMIQQLFQTGNL